MNLMPGDSISETPDHSGLVEMIGESGFMACLLFEVDMSHLHSLDCMGLNC